MTVRFTSGSSDADRGINTAIVLVASTYALTKLSPSTMTTGMYGWTIFEILRYMPEHNWSVYEEAPKTNPVLSKMMISGVVYSLGDWIAKCYEVKPNFQFDRTRMFRSGLVGFTLHGSLSHYYYHFCEVAFDQTTWSVLWNNIFFVVLGFLHFEPPVTIFSEYHQHVSPQLLSPS
ncbi:hypothetical protein BRADI_2g03206v3 [Brachypodium distachyon]|uniref:Uncharacterized protein n=1 Tax=Brachypodium distachyon TaxID=15368 RepID=A0A0Q3MEB4_BRADI|nr:hypothetical protein BRADI_2g03206v3 [Brachypodium distachyon]